MPRTAPLVLALCLMQGLHAQWPRTTGNAGTTAGTNFIGTTDNVALEMRVNNQRAGWITTTNNTALGQYALAATTGAGNAAAGSSALRANTTGFSNVAVGTSALRMNTTRSNLVAVGDSALYYNGVGALPDGDGEGSFDYEAHDNTAVGSKALFNNRRGSWNTGLGYRALYANTTGNTNTAVGVDALPNNTTGSGNVAVGYSVLSSNTTGNYNIAQGYYALSGNVSGSYNTASGYYALGGNYSGNYNTALGNSALSNNTTGTYNSAVGYKALQFNTTGWSNSALGYQAGPASGSTGFDNTTGIGFLATPTAANRITIGISLNNNLIGGFGAWQNLSDGRFKRNVQEDVPGLAFITKLRPVTYNLDAAAVDEYTGVKEKMESAGKVPDWYDARIREVSQEKLTGFIAQEVEQAAKDAGYEFDGVQHPHGDRDHYTIGYATFVVPLVKAVQEQQAQIEKLEKRIAELEKR